ncbi:MAG: Glu/Leu/Phe/Val dehydrogenase [Planctomycetes bacterium]|nr:Glu/Leu/Phe/Val dehydrogenase [Planctomycetota bacterium]MCC7171987.1 Glu/Leu/Phe/Val dehydrogenase [Planctomycetota bacterium]
MEIREIKEDGYERIVVGIDKDAGLHGIVAVHSTRLGPALGGLRMWPYKNEAEALYDVKRLSRGMTYKSAVAQTGLGGGKSVIIGDSRTQKSAKLFHAMGKLIDHLNGLYITAEDVGTSVEDLEKVAQSTKWVSGLSREAGGSGNPSPYTARGTFVGLKACIEEAFGSADFRGKTFAMQGVGAVALPLGKMLTQQGAKIVACDINPDNVARAKRELNATIVEPDAIFDVACDAFVPCALGAILNDQTIPRLKTRIVGGCANNQLAEPRHADVLQARGILYAPDYVINAGGIINVSCEFDAGGYREESAIPKVDNIYRALKEIFATAKSDGVTTAVAADRVAEKRLAEGPKSRTRPMQGGVER